MIRLITTVSILTLTSCTPEPKNIDYRAYSAILNAFLDDFGLNGKCVVIVQEAEDRKGVFEEILATKNIKGVPPSIKDPDSVKLIFENYFDLKSIVTYTISGTEFDSLVIDSNGDLDWKPFHDKFPGAVGLITLSELFLADDQTSGGVYISIVHDSQSGSGYYVLFDLKSEKVIVEKYLIWVG